MKSLLLWLLRRLEANAARKMASNQFRDNHERESARRLLATARHFRGALELDR